MGFVLIILSSILFGIKPTFLNQALQYGANVSHTTIISALFGTLLGFFLYIIRKNTKKPDSKTCWSLMGIGVVGGTMTGTLLYSSYRFIPASLATVLHFAYPAIVCIIMFAVFHIKIQTQRIIAIGFSIIGVICISGSVQSNAISGIVLAVGSGICFAIYIVCLDRLNSANFGSESRLFYTSVGFLIGSITLGLLKREISIPNAAAMKYLLLTGVFYSLAAFCLIVGISKIGAVSAALFSVLEPVCSLLMGRLFHGVRLTLVMLIGCLCIFIALILDSLADQNLFSKRKRNGINEKI